MSSRLSAVVVGARGVVRALLRKRMTAAMFCACREFVVRLVVAVGAVGGRSVASEPVKAVGGKQGWAT